MAFIETWHTCWPWGEDVSDTLFDSGGKCIAMVMAYYGKSLEDKFVDHITSTFWGISNEIWHTCWPWGENVSDTFFDSGGKCVAVVMAYNGKRLGENFADRISSTFLKHFKWNLAHMLALRCTHVQDTLFESGGKCIAMVMAYYSSQTIQLLVDHSKTCHPLYVHIIKEIVPFHKLVHPAGTYITHCVIYWFTHFICNKNSLQFGTSLFICAIRFPKVSSPLQLQLDVICHADKLRWYALCLHRTNCTHEIIWIWL